MWVRALRQSSELSGCPNFLYSIKGDPSDRLGPAQLLMNGDPVTDLDELKAAFQNGHAVLVIGTGASANVTANAVCANWEGLIRNGVEFAQGHDAEATQEWRTLVETQIDFALKSEDTGMLLSAAGLVAGRIKSIGVQAYSDWLQKSVGSLTVTSPDWASSILEMGSPILTTNYDTLLEEIGGRSSSNWEDGRQFQELVRTSSSTIGHLHGVWNEPSSVVFSSADYERHAHSESTQALQRALASIKTLVYLGYGSGLDDPNFSALLQWHREVFPPSALHHFRLCKGDDLANLQVLHANDSIVPISYGANYDDLPLFLTSLRPSAEVSRSDSGIVRDPVAELRRKLLEHVRDETLMADAMGDADELEMEDLVYPPALLPVPHPEYVESLRNGKQERIERLDPVFESQTPGVIVLVGDENAGLTTALRWLLWTASSASDRQAPLLVEYRSLSAGAKPLERRIRRAALDEGLINQVQDSLPPLVVAVDNFIPYQKVSARVAEELGRGRDGLTILGCRSGDETELAELLKNCGVDHRIRYLGKLTSTDIKAMARLAAPARADTIAANVITFLSGEHFPRTPITVSMLISILSQGGQLTLNASPTAILEQYVGLLLGRGEPDDDSRIAVGSNDRESILADLAQLFVDEESAGVLQSAATERLEQFFAKFAWNDSPSATLNSFVDRRLLRFEGTRVFFSQSSYLHLFAAKQSIKDEQLRQKVLDRPLYFAAVLRTYAALVQHDPEPLHVAESILDDWTQLELVGSAYSKIESIEPPDDLAEQFDAIGAPLATEESDPHSSDDNEWTPFDASEETDVVPFSTSDDSEIPPSARFAQVVELASTILRDSAEVSDLDLKQRVLDKSLRSWGVLVSALGEDPAFEELVKRVSAAVLEAMGEQNPKVLEFIDNLMTIFPAIVVAGGISAALSSRKLSLLLEKTISQTNLPDDQYAAFAAAVMLVDLQDENWIESLESIVDKHRARWVFQKFVLPVLLTTYISSDLAADAEHKLPLLVGRLYCVRFRFNSSVEEAAFVSKYAEALRRRKGLERRRDSTRGGAAADGDQAIAGA